MFLPALFHSEEPENEWNFKNVVVITFACRHD